jgi:competence ComEA-like helix-hairpin-helix protein
LLRYFPLPLFQEMSRYENHIETRLGGENGLFEVYLDSRHLYIMSHIGQMSTPLETGTRVEIGPSERESGRVTISPMDPGKKFVLGIPIPLNQAGAEALAIIPGISHSLACRIVEFRDSHGPFKTCHELRRVKGIGPKKVERFQSYLSLTETSRNQE